MNIHSHQKKIRTLLIDGEAIGETKTEPTFYPGCYIISRTMGYNLFKLGMAWGKGGLYKRIIGQYKICMSLKRTEFFLRYLVIAHREKEGKTHYSAILEKQLLKTIDSKVADSYSKEYIFSPDINKLETRIGDVLNSHKKYYKMAIKFTRSGFRLYDETKGFHTPLLDFDELNNLDETAASMMDLYHILKSGEDHRTKRKKKMIKFSMKKKKEVIKEKENVKF
jgi:hypothetical protein